MGGRLDAVNMLDANVAIISTIDLDHEQWLGNNREDIAREKSGIFRAMRPSVCGDLNPPAAIREVAEIVGSNLYQAGIDFQYKISGKTWSWQSGTRKYQMLPVPGKADFQVQNAATILMALNTMAENFPVSQEAILNGLAKFSMPGRFQVIYGEKTMVLDVAHNPQSAMILRQNIAKYFNQRRIIMVVAMLMDKNHEKFISELIPCVDMLCLAGLDTDRGASGEDLEKAIQPADIDTEVVVFDRLHQAYTWSETTALPGDVVVITGSFITVGKAIEFFNIEY
ncbi:MAG: bifunctional folylpolyglutamate synthase/dihydrofolate synthase, partial [Gammaproteobacteria bacterium]|nr:bifunctional folylpolyglutamate synthase/dihydrofolate synthase [Gammaproteobacteria bacterium]